MFQVLVVVSASKVNGKGSWEPRKKDLWSSRSFFEKMPNARSNEYVAVATMETYLAGKFPTDWTCPDGYYGGFDGCDCQCGTWDPDCLDLEATVYGCDVGDTCTSNGWNEAPSCTHTVRDIPDAWTCDPMSFNMKDGCDCNCGAWDPDCDDRNMLLIGCPSVTGYKCMNNDDWDMAPTCEQHWAPPEWTCRASWWNAGDVCDCGCGTEDPDCNDPSAAVVGCQQGQTCAYGTGICIGQMTKHVPEGWLCDDAKYNNFDGCDCLCGAWDPDCDTLGSTVLGCNSGETCEWNTDLERTFCLGDIPGDWTCPDSYYDAGDGCDCDCVAWDPDCDDSTQAVFGCDYAGQICEKNDGLAQCIDNWTCDHSYYDAGDGCDCNCVAWDPDCDDPTQNLFGCDDPGQICGNNDGLAQCINPPNENIPGDWTCDPSYYDAGDGCDCLCGAWDPDCDDPAQAVFGCPDTMTYPQCSNNDEWNEPPSCFNHYFNDGFVCSGYYFFGDDGCDCACGQWDPDCDLQGAAQDPLNCDAGQTCTKYTVPFVGEVSKCSGIPSAWFCSEEYYDSQDGCDCECGAWDPDCDREGAQDAYGCAAGQICTSLDGPAMCTDPGDIADTRHIALAPVDPFARGIEGVKPIKRSHFKEVQARKTAKKGVARGIEGVKPIKRSHFKEFQARKTTKKGVARDSEGVKPIKRSHFKEFQARKTTKKGDGRGGGIEGVKPIKRSHFKEVQARKTPKKEGRKKSSNIGL